MKYLFMKQLSIFYFLHWLALLIYILPKLIGFGDIRNIGSGNIGATYALRTGNKLLAFIVLICDFLKGLLPILFFSLYIILGYLFDMEVEFPTIYVTRQEGESFRADTRSSLVLHRVKLNLGDSGLYETTLQRTGKDDYTEVYEPIVADAYSANQIQFTSESIKTVPIYDRNTNTTLTLKSTHASPATLQSMTCEGDYNTKFYTSV